MACDHIPSGGPTEGSFANVWEHNDESYVDCIACLTVPIQRQVEH
jgi:hypothetical protein